MRLIAYKNPFEFQNLHFWGDIQKYPHLCVSQTLVEGLKTYYNRNSFSLICTIDNFLKHFYSEWHGNNEQKLFQIIHISNAIKNIKDKKLQSSFKHNRNDILQSIRFIIECGIKPSDIQSRIEFTEEQNCLIDLYGEVYEKDCFQTLFHQAERGVEGLYSCAKEIMMKELEVNLKLFPKPHISGSERLKQIYQKILDLKDLDNIDKFNSLKHVYGLVNKMDTNGATFSFDKVYIHGVHQFTPMIYKFVNKLQKLGVEVIFLFNYCSEFGAIYKTWDEIYKWTRADIEENGDLFQIIPRQLGQNLQAVFEGKVRNLQETPEVLYKFDNLTSFTDYVSPVYKKAKNAAKEEGNTNNLAIIQKMDEQFYAVDGSEINSLLKVYFPEHFGTRHFLSYPIGQFILGLYNMWDNHEKRLKIDDRNLKECLSLNIWRFRKSITPLQMYYDLSLYFKGATTFDEYKNRLEIIKKVVDGNGREQTRKLSFFSYTAEDIDNFIKVIEYITKFAKQLFKEGRVDLKEHYQDLIQHISEDIYSLDISEKERSFIDEIKTRLNEIEIDNVVADIEDIRETLHYYLAANEDKDGEAEWIVRDFEQIDGGILLAKNRDKKYGSNSNPIYHFAGLSDENLLSKTKKSLPFPITISMIEGMNEVATLIATCKKEYVHFLRYSLFYGTYFLSPINPIHLSYIEELGEEVAQPYSIFKILNMPIERNERELESFENVEPSLPYNDRGVVPLDFSLDDSMKRSAKACYLRFLYNHCLEEFTTYNDEFNLYYVSQLLAMHKIIQNFKEKGIDGTMTLKQFEKIYPFMDTIDFRQIEKMVRNNYKNDNDNNYINTKLEFKYAKWTENGNDMFKHIRNAYRMNPNEMKNFYRDLDRFINDDQLSFLPTNHSWKICDVCNQKYVCGHGLKIKESD